MAANSFKIKAWTMAIIGGVLALSKEIIFQKADTQTNEMASIGLSIFLVLVVLVFWYLDGFFLRTEKLYRNLYQWILKHWEEDGKYMYDLNTFNRTVNDEPTPITAPGIFRVMFSKTLWPFYLLPFLFVLGLLFFNLFGC
jgi:hypothetical protein